MHQHLAIRHENKSQPAEIPRTKIVEAFGLLKCQKLVDQVTENDLEVRNNALAVLSEEFLNPYSVVGCCQAGVINVLASMVVDPDYNTRHLSSRALAIAAQDANGLAAILLDQAVPGIMMGMNDPSEVVRGQIYESIKNISTTSSGVEACVDAQVSTYFVGALTREPDYLKTTILSTLHNVVSSSGPGLSDALAAGAVKTCIDLLRSDNAEVRTEAAKVLGFLCYDSDAIVEALEYNVVEKILNLLVDATGGGNRPAQPMSVIAAATMALMSATATDEGKRRVFSCFPSGAAVSHIAALLYVDNRVIRLNTMKVVSNIAVYPSLRQLLLDDNGLVLNLKRLRDSEDPLLEKHANIALAAVNWMP